VHVPREVGVLRLVDGDVREHLPYGGRCVTRHARRSKRLANATLDGNLQENLEQCAPAMSPTSCLLFALALVDLLLTNRI
jgi:hypothetical protein